MLNSKCIRIFKKISIFLYLKYYISFNRRIKKKNNDHFWNRINFIIWKKTNFTNSKKDFRHEIQRTTNVIDSAIKFSDHKR